jgi:hypothetical protein
MVVRYCVAIKATYSKTSDTKPMNLFYIVQIFVTILISWLTNLCVATGRQ